MYFPSSLGSRTGLTQMILAEGVQHRLHGRGTLHVDMILAEGHQHRLHGRGTLHVDMILAEGHQHRLHRRGTLHVDMILLLLHNSFPIAQADSTSPTSLVPRPSV